MSLGSHRRPFCRGALHQWWKLKNEKWNTFTRSPWVKNRLKRQHHAREYTLLIPGAAMRPGARLKKQCVKSWYNRPRSPPTQPWAANRPRAAAATRPPVTCSPLARAASRNTKFVCVGCRTKHLDQLENKNIFVLRGILSFREDYSRSAFREEIISKTRVILWWPFLRGKCVVSLRVILSFWDYFFLGDFVPNETWQKIQSFEKKKVFGLKVYEIRVWKCMNFYQILCRTYTRNTAEIFHRFKIRSTYIHVKRPFKMY